MYQKTCQFKTYYKTRITKTCKIGTETILIDIYRDRKNITIALPRISRPVVVGYPHHITQRGNYRQKIFESDVDYLQYLQWLQQYSRQYLLKVWAYCVVSNHVHFIAVPMESTSLAKIFHVLHMRYSQGLVQMVSIIEKVGNRK